MGLTAVKALCDCNGTEQSTRQALECFVSAKDILPSCTPILKSPVRTKCGVRRMLLSIFILVFIMAAIYLISFANQHRQSFRLPFRRQPQTQPENLVAEGATIEETGPEAEATEESAEDREHLN